MQKSAVIYTAIFRDYDNLCDPEIVSEKYDYVCFTDNDRLKSSIWDIRIVEPPVSNDYPRSNRYIKLHPHFYFPEYEYSMYVDGNLRLIGIPNIISILDGYSLAVEKHYSSQNIYEEAKACKRLGYGIAEEIDKQIEDYRKTGFDKPGLWANWVLVRKHNDPELIKKEEQWWQHIIRYSWRDQISFPYVFKDFLFKTLAPWFFVKNGIIRFNSHARKV